MKKIRGVFLIAALLILLCLGAYVGIARYYATGFTFGTWINGIYCTGKSIEEVNHELLAKTKYQGCSILFYDQHVEHYKPATDQITFDYTQKLKKIQQKQNPWLWPSNVVASFTDLSETNLMPDIQLDENDFHDYFYQLAEVTEALQRKPQVRILKNARDGYILENTKTDVLDPRKAYQICLSSIEEGARTVDLEKQGCYQNLTLTDAEQAVLKQYDRLNEFLNFELTYDMGDSNVVYGHTALSDLVAIQTDSSFLLDQDGNFTWDQEKVKELIQKLAAEYDTYKGTRVFHTTRGDDVTVTGGTYGNQIDQKKETEFLTQALLAHKTCNHIPAYKRQAFIRGKEDIGNTYIEVDLTNQMLYCYIDGKQQVDTPIVTGNMMRHRETPPGTYFIYQKQKNRILRGPGYASHVNFWMPVKNGIGIHDALWRDEFGGTIYQKAGSHGCINTPYDAMEKLYGICEVGMPVIMYQ